MLGTRTGLTRDWQLPKRIVALFCAWHRRGGSCPAISTATGFGFALHTANRIFPFRISWSDGLDLTTPITFCLGFSAPLVPCDTGANHTLTAVGHIRRLIGRLAARQHQSCPYGKYKCQPHHQPPYFHESSNPVQSVSRKKTRIFPKNSI